MSYKENLKTNNDQLSLILNNIISLSENTLEEAINIYNSLETNNYNEILNYYNLELIDISEQINSWKNGGIIKITAPTLSIRNRTLIISAKSKLSENYDIYLNDTYIDTIEAIYPESTYDFLDIVDGDYKVDVIAKGNNCEDSDIVSLSFTFAKKLPAPNIYYYFEPHIGKCYLKIPRYINEKFDSYDIYINNIKFKTLPHALSNYISLNHLISGNYIVKVVGQAENMESNMTSLSFTKRNAIAIANFSLSDKNVVIEINNYDNTYEIASPNTVFNSNCHIVDVSDSSDLARMYFKNSSYSPMTQKAEYIEAAAIEYGIKNIANYSFKDCYNLQSIMVSDSVVEEIGKQAFQNCSALKLISTLFVQTIGEEAFSNCTSLPNISFETNITNIGDYAFQNCSSLTDIYYKGTMAEWNSITFGVGWDEGTPNYTIHCTDGDITK